jgi:hypothetical protein
MKLPRNFHETSMIQQTNSKHYNKFWFCHRGRALEEYNDVQSARIESQQVKALIQEWGWGHCSAADVQRTAELAYNDQVAILKSLGLPEVHADPVLKHLSGLGGSGTFSGNIQRDLFRYLGQPSLPTTYKASIHVQVQKPRKYQATITSINMAFLLPHEWFHYFYTKRPYLWKQLILGGSEENPELFWNGVQERNDPRFAMLCKTPITRTRDWKKKTVAFTVHGDAVPVIAVGKAGVVVALWLT